MGPKRIAMVVLGVTAAIVVVISLIVAAIVVLPRDHRYAIGAQPGESAATAPDSAPNTLSAPAPSSTNPATATPAPVQDLPDPRRRLYSRTCPTQS